MYNLYYAVTINIFFLNDELSLLKFQNNYVTRAFDKFQLAAFHLSIVTDISTVVCDPSEDLPVTDKACLLVTIGA